MLDSSSVTGIVERHNRQTANFLSNDYSRNSKLLIFDKVLEQFQAWMQYSLISFDIGYELMLHPQYSK